MMLNQVYTFQDRLAYEFLPLYGQHFVTDDMGESTPIDPRIQLIYMQNENGFLFTFIAGNLK